MFRMLQADDEKRILDLTFTLLGLDDGFSFHSESSAKDALERQLLLMGAVLTSKIGKGNIISRKGQIPSSW